MSEVKGVPARIKEIAKKINEDNAEFSVETLLEIYELRQEILQNAGYGIYGDSVERLHRLVLMMQLLDDLVRDKLNIDRMRRLVRE